MVPDPQLLRAFGENLRLARLKRGLSQAALADMTGHAQGHISDIEVGNVNVHLETASLFARSLGISLLDLIAKHPDVELEDRKRFGLIVETARKQTGWAQTELAAVTGSTRPMIDAVEKGSVRLTLSMLRNLAAALGVETVYLAEQLARKPSTTP